MSMDIFQLLNVMVEKLIGSNTQNFTSNWQNGGTPYSHKNVEAKKSK